MRSARLMVLFSLTAFGAAPALGAGELRFCSKDADCEKGELCASAGAESVCVTIPKGTAARKPSSQVKTETCEACRKKCKAGKKGKKCRAGCDGGSCSTKARCDSCLGACREARNKDSCRAHCRDNHCWSEEVKP